MSQSRHTNRRQLMLVSLSATLLWSLPALAEEPLVIVSGQRVLLGELVASVSPGIARVDLGKAPPPGRTRYFSYEEIAARLRSAGIGASKLKLPQGVRVKSEARQFAADELRAMAEPHIRDAMASGMTLEALHVSAPRTLSPSVKMGRVRLPQFATKNGSQTQTGTIEVMWGDQVELRLPVKMTVKIDGVQAGQIVKRGSSITLSIRRGQVEISALAKTLSTGRVGDTVSVRIGVTKKVMSAVLVAPDRAEMQL